MSYRLIDHEPEGRTDKVSAMRGHSSCLVQRGHPFVETELGLSEFANSARRISFAAKSTVFIESGPSIATYVLMSGTAGSYKMLPDGRRQIVGFALAGDFLGSPFSNQYTYSVDAISEVAACEFLRGRFLTFLQASPKSLYGSGRTGSRCHRAHGGARLQGGPGRGLTFTIRCQELWMLRRKW